ncbi:unnamed protein product [Withania somnifera]
MDLLFSFLLPDRPHCALLAGYFSKVVVCLMLRKTIPLMNYVQTHHDVFRQMVDLIGITSIMEVLVRLVGADIYPNTQDVMQWLADSNLLEMIVDKLSPSSSPEIQANAAETLCTITLNAPSPLATKLSSPSFVARIFSHALEDSHSKSALIHSLSVCISLLDPKRSIPSPMMYSYRCQHVYESSVCVNPETISAMLPKLGNLLKLLNVSSDDKILPTAYGELRPPLGKHRLKIVEFISVLLKTGNEVAEDELISSGTIERILDLFFEYAFNNALHHHVESIINSCLESRNNILVDHLFEECNLLGKILHADKQPTVSGSESQPTFPATGKQAPRLGNIGHLTRIANKLVQLGSYDNHIRGHLEKNMEWSDWHTTVLQVRNALENVYRWACGRPTALLDRTRDSDEEDVHNRDYDISALANNLNQAFQYTVYDNNGAEEGHGALDRDHEDVYFDDESAEVVLRLGDDQGSNLFTNSDWFAFRDDRTGDDPKSTLSTEAMEEINLNGATNGGNSSSDDEVVVGEQDELAERKSSSDGMPGSSSDDFNGFSGANSANGGHFNQQKEKSGVSGGGDFFHFETSDNDDPFGDRAIPEWVAWENGSVGRSVNPFEDNGDCSGNLENSVEAATPSISSASCSGGESIPNGISTFPDSSNSSSGSDSSQKAAVSMPLFEEDVEFVGVEIEGTEKAMEHALKEGIVGEAAPLKRSLVPKRPEKDSTDEGGLGMKEFNDAIYWRVDQEVTVLE